MADPLWRLHYEHKVIEGRGRDDWQAAPVTGVQVLAKKLENDVDGRSRVLWWTDERYRELYYDHHFYAWLEDGPSGVTPDAVLDLWAHHTNDTSARVGDLSLEDLHAIGCKCGRSLPDEKFYAILDRAVNDPDIP